MKRNHRWYYFVRFSLVLSGFVLFLLLGFLIPALGQEPNQEADLAALTVESTHSLDISASAPMVWSTHFPQPAHYAVGENAFLLCTDAQALNQSNHYDAYAADSLAKLVNHSFSRDLTVLDVPVHAEFDYAVSESGIVITYVPDFRDTTQCMVRALPDGSSRVLVCFGLSLAKDQLLYYPILFDVSAGTATDLLASLDVDFLSNALDHQPQELILGEGGKMLMHRTDGKFLYFDLARSAIWDLEELVHTTIQDCTLLPGCIVCWNQAGDFMEVSLDTWEISSLLRASDPLYASGIWGSQGLPGSSFILYNDSHQGTCCYDFVTRSSSRLEGVTLDPAMVQTGDLRFYPCDDGRRVCLQSRSAEDGSVRYAIWDADNRAYYPLTDPLLEKATWGPVGFTAQGQLILAAENHRDFYFCDLANASPELTALFTEALSADGAQTEAAAARLAEAFRQDTLGFTQALSRLDTYQIEQIARMVVMEYPADQRQQLRSAIEALSDRGVDAVISAFLACLE